MERKKGYFSDGEAFVLSSSHNDIAFLDTPLVTILFRNRNIIRKAVEMIEEDPEFRHTMECSLYMRDYLALEGGMKERLSKVMGEGKLQCGATYTQLYESSVPSEGLARQYYLGKRWLEKTFPGFRTRTTWNQDVPGRTMQSAQIMKKCGVDYLFVSRMDAGFFRWYSPDGSSVTGYSNGHYHCSSISEILRFGYRVYDEDQHSGESSIPFYETDEEGIDELWSFLERSADSRYSPRNVPPVYGFLAVRDYDYPMDINNLFPVFRDNEKYLMPKFTHATAEEFMDHALTHGMDRPEYFDHWHGERPNLWIYHEMTHQEAMKAERNGLNVLSEAEALAAFLKLNGMKDDYPAERIEEAYEKLLYLDHGWGGMNGHVTDATYKAVARKGWNESVTLRKELLDTLIANVSSEKGETRILIWNPTQIGRTAPAECLIDWRKLGTTEFTLMDENGNTLPCQIVEEPEPWHIRILFTPTVPAYGYTSIKVVKEAHRRALPETMIKAESPHKIEIENRYYSMVLEEGGFTHIIDKETGKDIVDQNSPLRAFEVYELHSAGNGSGEFSSMQLPTPEYGKSRDKYGWTSGLQNTATVHNIHWRIPDHRGLTEADGEICTVIVGDCRFPHFSLREEIRIYSSIKKIDVKVDIKAWDGTMYEEVRIALPLEKSYQDLSYEVPFGILRVGKDEVEGPIGTKPYISDGPGRHWFVPYPDDNRTIHPREVQSWIAAENGEETVILTCPDTPSFDWYEYLCGITAETLDVQPILFASRHSCMPQGDPYPQTGDHSFRFSLFTGKGSLKDNLHRAEGDRQPFTAAEYRTAERKEGLPLTHSFLDIRGDVRVTAVKKAEDSDDIVLRCYEAFDEPSSFTADFGRTPKKTERTDMLEYRPEKLAENEDLRDDVKARSIETYMIEF